MSWNPEIVKIVSVEKHPNADSLDIVKIYSDVIVIAKIGEFNVGDLVSYFPIDTIPGNNSAFDFLEKNRNKRIKAKRLRGIFSTGFILKAPDGFKEGDSIIEHYNLTRYIADFERSEYKSDGLRTPGYAGNNASNPKDFEIPHYDLENARKFSNLFEKGEKVVLCEKLHGENFSMIVFNDKMYVRSRNFYKAKSDDSKWWEVAIRDNFEEKISKYQGYAFMGELYGNVSGFRYDCKIDEANTVARKFRCFDIYDVVNKKFLPYESILEICKEIGIETVPELHRCEWNGLSEIKSIAERCSSLNSNHISEGFVIRSLERSRFINNDRSVLKYVSEQFLESKYS